MTDVRRETCLWLAELASWRAGVIGALVKRYGDLSTAISRPRAELARTLQRKRKGRKDGDAGADAGGRQADGSRQAEGRRQTESEGDLWRAALGRLAPSRALASPPGALTVVFTDAAYPAWLRAIADPPPALFVLGDDDERVAAARWRRFLAAPRVAAVGCRRPTPYGLDMAAGIGAELVERGVVVVSGLAFGIDAGAHRGALRAETTRTEAGAEAPPPTVAVMGCGADVWYPRSHHRLWTSVRRCGLVVSEFVWGTPARAWRFPARNRVIAGLCHAVVVVEGTARSGALITCDRALDGGREVLAVPGEAGRAVTEGPHGLLRLGAALCESGTCVVDVLRGIRREDPDVFDPWLRRLDGGAGGAGGREGRGGDESESCASAAGDGHRTVAASARSAVEGECSRAHRLVLAALDRRPSSVDEVVAETGLTVAEVLSCLATCELDGRVAGAPGGVYRVVRGRGRRRNPPVGRRTPSHGDESRHDVRP